MKEKNPGIQLAMDLAAARLSNFDSALRKAEERRAAEQSRAPSPSKAGSSKPKG